MTVFGYKDKTWTTKMPHAVKLICCEIKIALLMLPAAKCGQWAQVDELITKVPEEARLRGTSGVLPLHVAVQYHAPHEVVVRLLQAFPAGALARDAFGMLPLHCAMGARASVKVIRELLAVHPAAVTTEDANGVTPLEMLNEHRRDDWRSSVAQELPRRFTSGACQPAHAPTNFHRAHTTEDGWRKALAQLESEPACAMVKDNECMLALHWAALYSAPVNVVDALLAVFPAAVTAKCVYGRLPLHYAIIGRASVDVVATLLVADSTAMHVRSGGLVGGTPLQIAQGDGADSVVSPGPPLADAVLALLKSPEQAALVPKVTAMQPLVGVAQAAATADTD